MALKTYQVFYHFYGSGASVDSDAPLSMNVADIYSPLLGQLSEDGDFIGLIDTQGGTLQVMYEAKDDVYWIEVIDVSKQGSHGKHMGFDELTDFFKALPEHFQPNSIDGSEFIAW